VVKEPKNEQDLAAILNHNMVEMNVLEIFLNQDHVKSNLVQVTKSSLSIILYFYMILN